MLTHGVSPPSSRSPEVSQPARRNEAGKLDKAACMSSNVSTEEEQEEEKGEEEDEVEESEQRSLRRRGRPAQTPQRARAEGNTGKKMDRGAASQSSHGAKVEGENEEKEQAVALRASISRGRGRKVVSAETRKRKRPVPSTPAASSKSAKSTPSSSGRRGCRNKLGETPLHVACKKGQLASVRQLLEEDACDIDAKDFAGWTALVSGSVPTPHVLLLSRTTRRICWSLGRDEESK